MFWSDVFDRVLIEPARRGANRLDIVSGYATPALASTHLSTLDELGLQVEVNLVVGMVQHEGLREDFHRGFAGLSSGRPDFSAYYVLPPGTVHSKVYLWYRDGQPVAAFGGSANYTRTGMGTGAVGKQRTEAMASIDPRLAELFVGHVFSTVIGCCDHDVDQYVRLTTARRKPEESELERTDDPAETPSLHQAGAPGEYSLTLSLLRRDGRAHNPGGGLNHGARPERHSKDEAYIPIPSEVATSGFFPPRGQHFLVTTDDDKTLIMSTGSGKPEKPKDLRTPQNNALLGEYFRNRLGVASGVPITSDHFRTYGRSTVEFLKLDDETYLMDFSQP